jgi:hypothetical protein
VVTSGSHLRAYDSLSNLGSRFLPDLQPKLAPSCDWGYIEGADNTRLHPGIQDHDLIRVPVSSVWWASNFHEAGGLDEVGPEALGEC